MSRELPTYRLGYAIEREDREYLTHSGVDPETMIRAVEDNRPMFNVDTHPGTLLDPFNQGRQGSCQGQALSLIFTICFWLVTGRIELFSRADAYYSSQRFDGIRGDRGSTLYGGRKVAERGLSLERDWPYPSRYNPREPAGIAGKRVFRLLGSQPTRDTDLVKHWLDMGMPVQDGIGWNSSVSRTLSTSYRGGGGGHSTTLWTKDGGNYRRINSWGMWDRDGCNENTPQSLDQQVRHRFSTHVLYAPMEMIYPEQSPVVFREQ